MFVKFEDWTKKRQLPFLGTNAGADVLPFQTWHRFKEAFAPELIRRAVSENRIPVQNCLDPFGGSGTTALAAQFLGVHATTIEVNPFLADIIEAKLSSYSSDDLADDLGKILRSARRRSGNFKALFSAAPATFVQPGKNDRWIFNRSVAERIAALVSAIEGLPTKKHVRFFKVILGGMLVELSNVTISGKGRRYRQNWKDRKRTAGDVEILFREAADKAIVELHEFRRRPSSSFTLLRGDCRKKLAAISTPVELAVFSPPYPNSFDYTDVYNLELWTLGYLSDRAENQKLRRSTLCSHVQISRDYPAAPGGSTKLRSTLKRLNDVREVLWDTSIPEMVGGYFADLYSVLSLIKSKLAQNGSVWMVVGDSRYADVRIRTGKILAELAQDLGYRVQGIEPTRSMRVSPQQGGQPGLSEELVLITKM